MLKFMRENAASIMWVAIVAFIGTIFFSWGMGNKINSSSEQLVGKVGDTPIRYASFANSVESQREQSRNSLGRDLTDEERAAVPQNVWNSIVSRIVHKKIISKLKLDGTADEILDYLKSNPPQAFVQDSFFQTNGYFDSTKYIRFIQDPSSYDYPIMREYENYAKDIIVPAAKLRSFVEAGLTPSKSEIEYFYHMQKDKAVFEYAFVKKKDFSKIDNSLITNDLLSAYYEKNKESYKVGERVSLYYFKLPKVVTKADEDIYRAEMEDIKKRIESGVSSFADAAKEESDDPGTAERGGELGWFKKEQMVKTFSDVAMSLKVGEISDPVRTKFGYHIIKLEGRNDTTGELKAAHILRKVEPLAETLDSLSDLADSIRQVIIDDGLDVAKKSFPGVVFDSTGLFEKGYVLPEIGHLYGLTSFAFNSFGKPPKGDMDVSDKMENSNAFYVFLKKETSKKGYKKLEEVKSVLKMHIVDSIATYNAKEYISKIAVNIGKEPSMLGYFKEDSLVVSGVTDTVSRDKYIDKIGFNKPAAAVAFSLPVGAVSKPVVSGAGVFIVKPIWKSIADSVDFNSSDVKNIRNTIISNILKNAYDDWYNAYLKRFKIENNLNDYYN